MKIHFQFVVMHCPLQCCRVYPRPDTNRSADTPVQPQDCITFRARTQKQFNAGVTEFAGHDELDVPWSRIDF